MRFRDLKRVDTRHGPDMTGCVHMGRSRVSADHTTESGLRRTDGPADRSANRALPTCVVWSDRDPRRTGPLHRAHNQGKKQTRHPTTHPRWLNPAKPYPCAHTFEVFKDRGVLGVFGPDNEPFAGR